MRAYPWESADTGREECPEFTADGANRFWTREEEVHVSADVAHGVMQYVEATGDRAFLVERRRRDPVRDEPVLGGARRGVTEIGRLLAAAG